MARSPTSWQFFSEVVKTAFYTSRGTIRGTTIFFRKKKSILERLRKMKENFLGFFQIILVGLSHFQYPEKHFEIGKILHPLWIFSAGCHIYTLSVQMRLLRKIASKKTYTVFIFPGDGWKIFRPFVWWHPGGLFKTNLRIQRNFLRKRCFFPKERIKCHLWYAINERKIFGFFPKVFGQSCHEWILCVHRNNLMRIGFLKRYSTLNRLQTFRQCFQPSARNFSGNFRECFVYVQRYYLRKLNIWKKIFSQKFWTFRT